MKSDSRLDRNFLMGKQGDRINAILCGADHNFRLLLRWLRTFLRLFLEWLRTVSGSYAEITEPRASPTSQSTKPATRFLASS